MKDTPNLYDTLIRLFSGGQPLGVALIAQWRYEMHTSLKFRPVAITLYLALTVSYVLCIAGDLLFGWTMYEAWAPLLPGFVWPLTAGGFIIGLFWIVGYSLYGAALLVLPYNYLTQQSSQYIEP